MIKMLSPILIEIKNENMANCRDSGRVLRLWWGFYLAAGAVPSLPWGSLNCLCHSRFILVTDSPRLAACLPLYTIIAQPTAVSAIIMLASRMRILLRQRSMTSWLKNGITQITNLLHSPIPLWISTHLTKLGTSAAVLYLPVQTNILRSRLLGSWFLIVSRIIWLVPKVLRTMAPIKAVLFSILCGLNQSFNI